MSQIDHASFLYGSNATFIAELYSRFVDDPASVDESWRQFFAELRDDAPAVLAELHGADWAPNQTQIISNGAANGATNGHAGNGATAALAASPKASPTSVRRRSIRSAP